MNTIKKSWRDVSINEYYDLKEKLSDDTLEESDKIIIKLAFATGMNESDIWNLNLNDFRKIQVETLWMDEFSIDEKFNLNKIKISGNEYTIDTNLQNFTVAQYIDFQTFYPKIKNNENVWGNILACVIIPKGKKYADGYDIQKLVEIINDNLDIMTANEIMFFFLKKYLISTRVTVNYFNWMMKRMKKKARNKKEYMRIIREWEIMKKNIFLGLHSLTV